MRGAAYAGLSNRVIVLSALLAIPSAHCQAGDNARLTGDLGLSANWTQASAPDAHDRTQLLPYAYADAGRLFIRVDTFGAKLAPLGWGSLELAGRFSTEGADSAGPRFPRRSNPRPVGLGTFQETPWGGVFLNAFVDTVSGGTLLEASYAAQMSFESLTFYPQVGVARRSARYTRHLYGLSAADSASAGRAAYAPDASTTAVLGLSAELPVAAHWVIVAHVQREGFDRAVSASPRVDRTSRASALIALAYRFD